MAELIQREKDETNRKLQERKNKKAHVSGIRKNFKRSEKPGVTKTEEVKQEISEDAINMQKYLGMFMEEEKKQQ